MSQQAYLGDGKAATAVPGDMADDVEAARVDLIEAAAESDDALMEKYFEAETLSDDEIKQGLREAGNKLVPVFAVSSTHNIGVGPFLDAALAYVRPPSARRVAIQAGRDGDIEYLEPPLSDSGPEVAYVFHSYTDKYGTLTYFRLFGGALKSNDTLRNLDADEEERLGGLMTMRGETQIPLDELHAGDIGVVAKLRFTHTGQTLAGGNFRKFVAQPHFSMPVYAVALNPRTQSDSAKMGEVLTSLTNADRTLHAYQNQALNQTILEGMGGTHIDVAIRRAERMGVSLDTAVPKVPYQETITRTASSVYRHKKQTGGAGQFAEVHLRVEPLPTPTAKEEDVPEFEFANEVFGGAISGSFVGSTEKGVRQVLGEGVIAGYPVKYVKAVVYDGKMHPVDSKDIAFQIAGRGAFREAFQEASPVLLEPIMKVDVTVPAENMGDIMGDMNTRRGRVLGMNTEAGRSTVSAEVPLAEIQRYSNDLRSMTAGRGVFTMDFLRYERVPPQLQAEIIAKAQKAKEEA
jgi:elongation factor G